MIPKIKSKIDDKLDIFKSKKVILFGGGIDGIMTFKLLQYFNIEVFAFCDNNKSLQNSKIQYINVISPYELSTMNKKNILVIICSTLYENEIAKQLELYGINFYLTQGDCQLTLLYKKMCSMKNNNKEFKNIKNLNASEFNNYFLLEYGVSQLLYICLPAKTADNTLLNTLDKNKISYCQMWHEPNKFNKNLIVNSSENVKVITAVREPISYSFSLLYQTLEGVYHIFEPLYLLYGDNIPNDGIDMQLLYDKWTSTNSDEYDLAKITDFFPNFKENILDIFKYPFDKDNGYTVIKEGNLEIFIYQLEKLNDLVPELAEFVGGSFTTLENSNLADGKWYSESYNQAKKEMQIPKEYFDECFNLEYVKHCYSESDIENFKARWKNNIK